MKFLIIGYTVAMFAKCYMMNYLLFLHTFPTTSLSARWGQLWLIQLQSFSKQSLGLDAFVSMPCSWTVV